MKRVFVIWLNFGLILVLGGCSHSQNVASLAASTVQTPASTSTFLAESSLSDLPAPPALAAKAETTAITPVLQPVEPFFILRGIWVHPDLIATRAKADETLARVEANHFNAIFLLILRNGYAYYNSSFTEKEASIEQDYDPLSYVVAQAHQRGIQVHAWFLAGRVGTPNREPGPILSAHPEWAMLDASGSPQTYWLNFARPDARQFMSDLIMEVVQNYDIDGVHLDYIRYPGADWSFDPYSIEALSARYNVDLERLRYKQLPAYGSFRGNPLLGVRTAQVLAEFDDGIPAVLLNTYANGKVIVLNWHAEDQQIAASSEILNRSINFLLGPDNQQVYIFRSDINEAKYTDSYFWENKAWLENLGWKPLEATVEDLATLDKKSVLVLPNIYIIDASTATELTQFVAGGGGLIFIDGPGPAMGNEDIQLITGMSGTGRFFNAAKTLSAVGESELIPGNGPSLDLTANQDMLNRWNSFREESVTNLVRDVYQRVKVTKPDVQVSAAVLQKQSWAAGKFQNWYGWLADGYLDFAVPMADVQDVSTLSNLTDEWQSQTDLNRITAGLYVADFTDQARPLKTPEELLAQLNLLQQRGINKVVIFSLGQISDDQLKTLATNPFESQVKQ